MVTVQRVKQAIIRASRFINSRSYQNARTQEDLVQVEKIADNLDAVARKTLATAINENASKMNELKMIQRELEKLARIVRDNRTYMWEYYIRQG